MRRLNTLKLNPCFLCIAAVFVAMQASADDTHAAAPANLKAQEFPSRSASHTLSGELVTLDFYHRKGQFRTENGELHDFIMPPYGTAFYLNTEADLRHFPLGTRVSFSLLPDGKGQDIRLALMQDQFTLDASQGISYRLDEVKLADGKLLVTKQNTAAKQPDLGKQTLVVSSLTRVWKRNAAAKLEDLAAGDDLLFNLTDGGRCIEIWADADSQKQATEAQKKKYQEFLKFRGIPAWIDKTEGQKLIVTLFSADPKAFKEKWANDFTVGKDISVVVANDELRTWNPPVDREGAKVDEVQAAPVDVFGCSGVRLSVTVKHMLEGFRRGHIVRLFGPGWPCKDMPFGEGIYTEMQTDELNVLTPKEFPAQFPFRTDYGNEHLPWYKIKNGEPPPHYSAHLVMGELVKVDASKQAGQFRTERTGELVDFMLIPKGALVKVNTNKLDDGGPVRFKDSSAQVMYLNAVATLDLVPLGTRCRFFLYQDEKGAFTKASLITDEFTYLALNKIVYRVDALLLAENKLHVIRQIPQRKDYNGDMVQPPDIGCAELRVNPETRVWKGEQQVKLADIAIGDLLLINQSSEQTGRPATCTDIWIGADTQAKATEKQSKKTPQPKN